MKSRTKPRLAITLGDPGGIGPEVTATALASKAVRDLAHFTLIGSRGVYERCAQRIPAGLRFIDIPARGPIKKGRIDPVNGRASLQYLEEAVTRIQRGDVQALVTAPVCKEAISMLGQRFHGHTEFLADRFHAKNVEMMFVFKNLRVVLVTRHIPLREVPRAVTGRRILRVIRLTENALKKTFHLRHPRIGVLGLNPHAGEGGLIGKEEIREIIPAIHKARRGRIRVDGPLAADTVFCAGQRKRYDALIAMYHDQGLIGVKTMAFENVVNLTLGLPFIRTSPPHGTAFDIAGKNRADPRPMREAIKLAATLARR